MIRVALQQNTPEWSRWRDEGIGASDAPPLMGVSPYRTAGDVIRQKARRTVTETTFAMRRGTFLEPTARELYRLAVGCEVEVVCLEHPDARWLRSSLDGLCWHPAQPGEQWALEIKCPNWKDHDGALAGIVPRHYLPQVQHQLVVTGLTRCDYVSFNDGKRFGPADQLAVVPVTDDPEYQAELLDRLGRVWTSILELRRRRVERARRRAA